MNRWVLFAICALSGVMLFVCGLLVPAHLRAVDVSVIELAGRNTPSLTERGLELVSEGKPGPAKLLYLAGKEEGIRGVDELGAAINNAAATQTEAGVLGRTDPRLEAIFGVAVRGGAETPFTEFIIGRENREKALEHLRNSSDAAVRELLGYRTQTKTVLFSPSESASGQALDAAIGICGLLLDGGHFTVTFKNDLHALAVDANHGGQSQQRFEQVLLDLMSLGQRYDWGQLTAFVAGIEETETLRLLANLVRREDDQAPVLFAAVQMSGQPAGVVEYVMQFSETGMEDIKTSLHHGVGGVRELLKRDQQLQSSELRSRIAGMPLASAVAGTAAEYAWLMPRFTLTAKWLLYLGGGFLLAMAVHFARPVAAPLERPLEVRGFHYIREFLFALGFLLVVLLLSEPFLAQESQRVEFPFRLQLPTVGDVVAAGTSAINETIMNKYSLLTLVLFFVIQSLIYTGCLVKLAEVRRQSVTPRIKLKLLDNEDHLFDAGLYIGFVGTIISLILVSLGIIKLSLMAGYSSTAFGIIFVCIFKIFHLRPARRTLLLEAETTRMVINPAPAYATQP